MGCPIGLDSTVHSSQAGLRRKSLIGTISSCPARPPYRILVSKILSIWILVYSTSPIRARPACHPPFLEPCRVFRYVISLFSINSITTPSDFCSYLDRIAMDDSHLWQTYYTVKTVWYMR